MQTHTFVLDVPVSSIPHGQMPANCEVLARTYVGDQMFGLARDPHGRSLYLLSVDGYCQLDPQRLLAAFADALREADRARAWQEGRGYGSEPVHTAGPEPAASRGVDAGPRPAKPFRIRRAKRVA